LLASLCGFLVSPCRGIALMPPNRRMRFPGIRPFLET